MSETLFHTNFLELKSTQSKSGNPWIYAHRPNAKDVVVILTCFDDEILFIIEERPPIQAENRGKYTIGLVAGLVGDERNGETIEDAVRAELLEEAGLVTRNIEIKARNIASSAGCVSETFTVALAEVQSKIPSQEPVSDDGVIVNRIWIKKEDVHSWLRDKEKNGYVLTSQALSALYYLYE